ncbi:hypothetical protein [Streptomyces sp. NPDC005209]|uniref:hypothetical protein n=1 Tax=Streptomyces sp. NPDC005209 TaxID=3156715 RepID=UPI0033B39809
MRTISAGLAKGDFRATMNRDLVAKVLSGRQWPTAWQLDSLVRWLASRAIDGKEPDAEAGRLLWLYQQAEAEGDGTLRSPGPTRSSLVIASNFFLGMGVLLADGTVLTRAYVVGDNPSLGVRSVDRPGTWCEASVAWRTPEDPEGFAVLAPETVIAGAAGARWGAPPRSGARVRIYGARTRHDSDGQRLDGLWLAGIVMGPSGAEGDWQLDFALPTEPKDEFLRGIAAAGVLDESGRVVGVVSHAMLGSSFIWMTPFDTIADQVPSITRRQPSG